MHLLLRRSCPNSDSFAVALPVTNSRKKTIWFLLAFITGNSSLEPLLEGLFVQIHIDLSWRGFGRNRTWDLRNIQICEVLRSPPLSYGDGCITEDPSGPFKVEDQNHGKSIQNILPADHACLFSCLCDSIYLENISCSYIYWILYVYWIYLISYLYLFWYLYREDRICPWSCHSKAFNFLSPPASWSNYFSNHYVKQRGR